MNQINLYDRNQAAHYLGIKPQTLAVWCSTGRYNLPIIKVGRCVRYAQADLDAFVSRNRISGGVQ